MLHFTDRMDAGRDVAMTARNRGRHTGKCAAGWNFNRPSLEGGTWEALCSTARHEWQAATRQARNDFAAACLNGVGLADYDGLAF